MLSRRELMDLHVRVLFRHDAADRLRDVNEPPYARAPRWFAGSTPEGNVYRYGDSISEGARLALQRAAEAGPRVDLARAFAVLAGEEPVTAVGLGPAYVFSEPAAPGVGAAGVRRVTSTDRACLQAHFRWIMQEIGERQPCFAVIEGGVAVSVCCSARGTARAAEASLATVAGYRGRGYAVDVTRAWAAAVQAAGRIALYSTAWDNFASQAVARKLALVCYGMDAHMT